MNRLKPLAVVYLAAPYSSDPERNTKEACRLWDLLNSVHPDTLFYCPHWSHLQHQTRPLSHDEWLRYDLKILETFLASGIPVAIHRTPGESIGADIEVMWAKQVGVPVFEGDDDACMDWLDDLGA